MPATTPEINLLKGSGINAKPLGKFLRWTLTYGRYIIIGTQIIVLLAFFSRFKLDQDLSDLHSRVEEKVSIVTALNSVETNTRNLQAKIDILSKLESDRSLYVDILKTLASETPEDVAINQLIFNQNKLSFNGRAITNAGFSNFLTFIRNSQFFNRITLEEINSNTQTNMITFKLSMQIQPLTAPKK